MSPSPSARISAAAPGRSRSASHSAGCPWCGLWCTNPDSPAEAGQEKEETMSAPLARRHEPSGGKRRVKPLTDLFTRLDGDVFRKDFLGFGRHLGLRLDLLVLLAR